jgi:hypothetical protein
MVGGSGGASGSGKLVNVENTGSITTSGAGSIAIVAQSIGGGGGLGGTGAVGEDGEIGVGGRGGAAGNGGMVTVTQTGDIATSGVAAHGVLAQSIGGGGGYGGNMDSGIDTFGQMNFGWAQQAVAMAVTAMRSASTPPARSRRAVAAPLASWPRASAAGWAGRQHRHRVQLRTGHGHQQWPPLCRQRRGHGGER